MLEVIGVPTLPKFGLILLSENLLLARDPNLYSKKETGRREEKRKIQLTISPFFDGCFPCVFLIGCLEMAPRIGCLVSEFEAVTELELNAFFLFK